MNIALSRASILRAAAALGATACVAGCGGASDHGVAAKSGDGIFAAARTALDGAQSVHVSGSVIPNGKIPVTLDLTLVPGKGGSGRLTYNGAPFQLVVLGQTVYIKGSNGFWHQALRSNLTAQVAGQLVAGTWLRAPARSQFAATFTPLTQVRAYSTGLLSTHGPLSKGATSTVDGQKAVAVQDPQRGGTLYVATNGKPYPILWDAGPGVRLVFDRYNRPVSLSAPAHSIEMPGFR